MSSKKPTMPPEEVQICKICDRPIVTRCKKCKTCEATLHSSCVIKCCSIPRTRIPGTKFRVRQANHSDEEIPDETTHSITASRTQEEEEVTLTQPQIESAETNVMSRDELLDDIMKTRPKIVNTIPTHASTCWAATIEKICHIALNAESQEARQYWTIVFLAAPHLLLQCDYDQIVHHLTSHHDDLTFYLRKREKRQQDASQANPVTSQHLAKILIENNQCRKALDVLMRTKTSSCSNPVEQLKRKVIFDESYNLHFNTPSKTKAYHYTDLQLLKRDIMKLPNGKCASLGLWKAEHLKSLVYTSMAIPHTWTMLTSIVTMIEEGETPYPLTEILNSSVMFAIPKGNTVRPIAVGNLFTKLAARRLVQNVILRNLLPPTQCGYGKRNGPQLATKIVQAHLDKGHIVFKTDVQNAFNSVDRAQLAAMLFDTPASKLTWDYFIAKYRNYSTFHVIIDGKPTTTINSNIGIDQGDALSLWYFDFFMSDIKINGAKEIVQIHDDLYVITDTQNFKTAYDCTMQYFKRKRLNINEDKTKILCKCKSQVPDEFRHLWTEQHLKIGGGYVQAQKQPLTHELIHELDYTKHLVNLPHQHAFTILTKSIIPKWKYIFSCTHPSICGVAKQKIIDFQKEMINRILKTSHSDTVTPNETQMFSPTIQGGLGLYLPDESLYLNLEKDRPHRTQHKSIDQIEKSKWFSTLCPAAQASLFTPHGAILTIAPFHRHLKMSDDVFSTFMGYLLLTWKASPYFCKKMQKTLHLSATNFVDHSVSCSSCSGYNKSFRHDNLADSFANALRANGVTFVLEPKNWPLRSKSAGKDGPDGIIYFHDRTEWIDFAITHQQRLNTHNTMTAEINLKNKQYETALKDLNINVVPMVYSSYGAQCTHTQKVMSTIKQTYGAKTARDVNNSVGCSLARAVTQFKHHIELKILLRDKMEKDYELSNSEQ